MTMRLARLFRAANTQRLATYLIALWKLFQHPQTPKPAKWVAIFVLAYALSPIDLIPDFIPVLGLLDDLILVPLGVALAVRLTPKDLWQAQLIEAEAAAQKLPPLRWGALIVIAMWVVVLGLLWWWLVA